MYSLAITPGEPAGIGPDVLIKAAQLEFDAQLIAVSDPKLLVQRAEELGLSITIDTWHPHQPIEPHRPGHLWVLPVPLATHTRAGQLNTENSGYVVETLQKAAQGCLTGAFQAMTTAPVQKSVINQAGISFSGHTEFLQEKAGVEKVVMMLASPNLKVALVTTHLPLRDVADAITTTELRKTIKILHRDLIQYFGTQSPNILVAGLNPHAGENGYLGTEEIDVMQPVIAECLARGISLEGPLPADTLFTEKYLSRADAVLAMYHDQGLPVLKNQGFGESVNITLGLPFIRTSVDHGTALDLAGTGQADEQSLVSAINMAIHMIKNRDAE